jgi:hypothetical protein
MRKVLKHKLIAKLGNQSFKVPLVVDTYGFHVDQGTGDWYLVVAHKDTTNREHQVDVLVVKDDTPVEHNFDYTGSTIIDGQGYHVYTLDCY